MSRIEPIYYLAYIKGGREIFQLTSADANTKLTQMMELTLETKT